MDIHFVAYALFDFLPQSRAEELHEALSYIYGEEADDFGGATFGGGSWHRHVYGNGESNHLEDESEFQWVRTIVERNTWGILDIITIAYLSDDQVDRIVDDEDGNSQYQARQDLDDLLEDVPTIVDGDPTDKASICFVEPKEVWDLWGEDGLEMERIQDTLEEHKVLLNRFGFTTSGYLSFVSGFFFIAPEVLMQPWDRLVAVSRGMKVEDPTPDQLITGPIWLGEFGTFQTYFRTYYWCQFRSGEVLELDTKVDENRDLLVSESSEDMDIDTVFELARSNRSVSTEWVDLHSWIIDEIDGLRRNYQSRADESVDPTLGPYDITIPREEEGGGLVFGEDQSDSLVTLYEDGARDYLDNLESNVDRVNKKQEILSNDIGDLVSVNATRENIELQSDVKELTEKLGRLTLALVVLTVFLVFLTLILLLRPLLL